MHWKNNNNQDDIIRAPSHKRGRNPQTRAANPNNGDNEEAQPQKMPQCMLGVSSLE